MTGILVINRSKFSVIHPSSKPKTPNGFTICVDPGHGIGAINVGAENPQTKILEHNEVLRAGFILEKLLLERGFKVVMTRRNSHAPGLPKDDLAARIQIAEKVKADFLLSLHMDCWVNSNGACAGAGVLFNSKAGQTLALGLASALNAVTQNNIYIKNRDDLWIAKFSKPMLLLEIDRVQHLPDADLQKRMKAVAFFLSNWFGVS